MELDFFDVFFRVVESVMAPNFLLYPQPPWSLPFLLSAHAITLVVIYHNIENEVKAYWEHAGPLGI